MYLQFVPKEIINVIYEHVGWLNQHETQIIHGALSKLLLNTDRSYTIQIYNL